MLHLDKSEPTILWRPSENEQVHSGLARYQRWLEKTQKLVFPEYKQLWEWSIKEPEEFWKSLWEYFGVKFHKPYTSVLKDPSMPGAKWFSGSMLNYAEHIFLNKEATKEALFFKSEQHQLSGLSWKEMTRSVVTVQQFLKDRGVVAGDRVAGYLPTIPEATVAFLATISLGVIWSSCSPDFGSSSVIDRFQQIKPKVLFAADGYCYGGKAYDKTEIIREIVDSIESIEQIVLIPFLDRHARVNTKASCISWDDLPGSSRDIEFVSVPFEHPLWVLYSSGTTGKPKAITHSHGGMLLEHMKYLTFHNDVRPGERFFWYSTTGWMMWNFVQAAFLTGASIVLYDGSPAFPDLYALWDLVDEAGIHHFGTSAPFLVACMKAGVKPLDKNRLSSLRSIGSTGSPLPPEAFGYVYNNIKPNVWLCSMSGGTDVCSAFVGGCPTRPVYMGEIQARCLGCALWAYNEHEEPVTGEVGEMVITKPMPCMPIYFWNDRDNRRYKASYFDYFPGVWRHGDWIEITHRDTLIIYGRSDATLNRQGVRIGTSEIYRAINTVKEIRDSLVIHVKIGDRELMPLFVVLKSGRMTPDLEQTIKNRIREMYSPRHVPDKIVQIDDVPYTISGKKMETPVKKILMGQPVEQAANLDSMRNPGSLQFFVDFQKSLTDFF